MSNIKITEKTITLSKELFNDNESIKEFYSYFEVPEQIEFIYKNKSEIKTYEYISYNDYKKSFFINNNFISDKRYNKNELLENIKTEINNSLKLELYKKCYSDIKNLIIDFYNTFLIKDVDLILNKLNKNLDFEYINLDRDYKEYNYIYFEFKISYYSTIRLYYYPYENKFKIDYSILFNYLRFTKDKKELNQLIELDNISNMFIEKLENYLKSNLNKICLDTKAI
jgi:hypothetical protein